MQAAVRPSHGENSAHFIDVTRADGVYVREPLVARDEYDEAVAAENSRRIQAILMSDAVGEECVIYFPAGVYHFNGAAEGWDATIQSTHARQTFAGDGSNGTTIAEKGRGQAATIKLAHDCCTVRDLQIRSSDRSEQFVAEWDHARHKTAILLEATGKTWHVDPQILDVNINSSGNTVAFSGFHRPFETGIEIVGPWLDVYVRTAWLRDVRNGIRVDQGALIAGPAHLIDINHVATPPTQSKEWTTFFRSESRFMEVVKILNCFFIGSQFVYMEGEPDDPQEHHNPAYTMVMEQNYLNTNWGSPGDGPRYAGVYLNLPPLEDHSNSSRNIRFTGNYVSGRTPPGGAFFHLSGACHGVEISGNHFSSGGGGRCIEILPTMPMGDDGVAIRDVRVTNNYVVNYRAPMVIGRDSVDGWVEGLLIQGNQSTLAPVLKDIGETGCVLTRVRKGVVSGNAFAPVSGSSVLASRCEGLSVSDNHLRGQGRDTTGAGMAVQNSRDVVITGNHMRQCPSNLTLERSSHLTIGSNVLEDAGESLRANACQYVSVQGNHLGDCGSGATIKSCRSVTLTGNTVSRCETAIGVQGTHGVVLNGNQIEVAGVPLILEDVDQCVVSANLALDSGDVQLKGQNPGLSASGNGGMCMPDSTGDE